MNRQIALAYGIAGLAVAVALVVGIGATTGLLGGPPAEGAGARTSPPPAALAPAEARTPPAPATSPPAPAALADTPEVVYVDAPAARGHDDDDDDDDHHRGRDHRRERDGDD